MSPRSSVKNNGVNRKASARMPGTTRKQKDEARERGDIRGWIGLQSAKQAVGRPKKALLLDLSGADDDNGEQEAKKRKTNADAEISVNESTKKQARGQYDQWRKPGMFDLLKAAVVNDCAGNACSKDLLLATRVPRQTAQRHKAAFLRAAKEHSIPLSDVTRDMIFPEKKMAAGRHC